MILIISYKILVVTEISNEKTDELTMYRILCQNITIFYRKELAFFSSARKLKAFISSKLEKIVICNERIKNLP